VLGLASGALETEDNLLGSLGLLTENRLGLTTITCLLAIVTALTLSDQGSSTSLVLSYLQGEGDRRVSSREGVLDPREY